MASLFEGEVTLRGHDVPVAQALPPSYFMEHGGEKLLKGLEQHRCPINYWMHRTLWTVVGNDFTSQREFDTHFDWVEIVAALANQSVRAARDSAAAGWFPSGKYNFASKSRDLVVARIEQNLERFGDTSPYVVSGLFGNKATACRLALANLKAQIAIGG